jgi:hypothetical protein
VWYDGDDEMYFRGGWSHFAEDHDLHQGFSWSSITIVVHWSLMWRSMMLLSARRSMRQKYTFIRCSLDVIFPF